MTNATPQIHCSARTLKEIGVPPKSMGYGDAETDQFFCWYCNLLYINRKKHLMFVVAEMVKIKRASPSTHGRLLRTGHYKESLVPGQLLVERKDRVSPASPSKSRAQTRTHGSP